MEISNALSEAELKQMKFLARPKVDAFRLKKIREGFKLFEELETNGELSCTYVRELLKGIQRFDLLQKLDRCMPLLDNAESGKPSAKKNRFLIPPPCKLELSKSLIINGLASSQSANLIRFTK